MNPDPRLARLEFICREQDRKYEQREDRHAKETEALKAAMGDTAEPLTTTEQNRVTLLDQIADRCPELGAVGDHEVEWRELPDGDEALLLDRSGLEFGRGCFFVLHGDDVLAIGPMGTAATGVFVIHGDGSRELLSLRALR